MKKNSQITPMVYLPQNNLTADIIYISFPKKLKDKLIELKKITNSKYNDIFGLPTGKLKPLLWSYLDGALDIKGLKENSEDSRWLTAFEDIDRDKLCQLIKIWIKTEFVVADNSLELIKDIEINPEDFIIVKEKTLLFDEKGLALNHAYKAYPLLVINSLIGKKILVSGKEITLNFLDKEHLISEKIKYKDEFYSVVIKFSLQTTPPERKPILICTPAIRRFVKKCISKNPFVDDKINAHIKISDCKYTIIPMEYDKPTQRIIWNKVGKQCYDLYNYKKLPEVVDVIKNCHEYQDILLPYSHKLSFAGAAYVKSGVSVVDKSCIYNEIGRLIGEFASLHNGLENVSAKWFKVEEFSFSQLLKSANCEKIYFEIYHNSDDVEQAEKIRESLLSDIKDYDGDCLEIELKELGSWSLATEDDSNARLALKNQIIRTLPKIKGVTACFVIIPDKDSFGKGTDPKNIIRSAFASSNRLTQFMVPVTEDEKILKNEKQKIPQDIQKIQSAKRDLYRQLGYLPKIDTENYKKRLKIVGDFPKIIGVVFHHQLEDYRKNRARFLPMFVTIDFEKSSIYVSCKAFKKQTMLYREALLEMNSLSLELKFKEICNDATKGAIKRFLIDLKHLYGNENTLVMAVSDGTSRNLFKGLSDSEILKEFLSQEKLIDVGDGNNSYKISLEDSLIRMLRFRTNDEVPDYITEEKEDGKFIAASGIYKSGNLFYSVASKNNDSEYNNSYKESKVQHPNRRYAERDLIEIYPMVIGKDDKAENYVNIASAMRRLSVQYDGMTRLPMPIHLGNLIKEYLFKG